MPNQSTQYTRRFLDKRAKELAQENKIVRPYWTLIVTNTGASLLVCGTVPGDPHRFHSAGESL